MAEGQVTIEGETHSLAQPFFVIATQNPLDLVGTFPLPDSQLDRFLLSITLGFPDPAVERELLVAKDRATVLAETAAVLSPQDVLLLQQDCESIHASASLLDYIQSLLAETRNNRWFEAGLSPRAGIALLHCGRALAFLEQRDFVAPEDVKTVFAALARHRMTVPHGLDTSIDEHISGLLAQVAVP